MGGHEHTGAAGAGGGAGGGAGLRIGAGLSGLLDSGLAAEHAAARARESLNGQSVDLALVFLSMHHVGAAGAVASAVHRTLGPKVLIGCSGESVIGGDTELENAPGVSVMALSLPGVRVHAFDADQVGMPPSTEDLTPMAEALGMTQAQGAGVNSSASSGADYRGTIFLVDPFSVHLAGMLPLMAKARPRPMGTPAGERAARAPIIGGLAIAGGRPGSNAIILNDRVMNSGGVGVSLSGNVEISALVSQGCQAIGTPLIVTGVKGQMVTGLGGRPALDVLTEILNGLNESMREKLRRGLFLGRAVNEYKDRFGRDDFLMRNVIGVDKEHSAIAVADMLRVGQTVQFHVRDATTADEDLALLLDAQQLHDPPAGVLLFNCNGRGTRLFPTPHHDALAFSRAFAPAVSAELKAKAGLPVPAPSGQVPLAGFACAGEIGPVGDDVFVHGQTACAMIIRPPSGSTQTGT